jgi:PAS domain S-box-containing protein
MLPKDESRFESIFNHVNEGILIGNAQGEIILSNPKCNNMFGYEENELKGQKVEVLIPQEYSERHVAHRNGYMNKPSKRPMGKNITLFGRQRNGEKLPVEVSLSYYNTNEGLFVIAFIIDITERYLQQEKIYKINEELKLLNETLEKKVSERTLVLKEALEALEQSRDELTKSLEKEKELNEMKSRFISMASHEFRTPLSTILSSASLIGKYVNEEQQENREKHIERIKKSVVGLTEILNDFLSLGKLEEGKVYANPVPINCKEILDELVAEMLVLCHEKQNIILKYEGAEPATIDKQMFRNVIINLISNAIKFSPSESSISINAIMSHDVLKLEVIDKGIGISKEDMEHLYERFYRGKNATNIQGTGLGLNITARYIELMNGKIDIASKLNVGTTITIELPNGNTI